LKREVRITNRATARWRENVERKKVKRKKEKERGQDIQGIESRQINWRNTISTSVVTEHPLAP
jgi:hypothetical protein